MTNAIAPRKFYLISYWEHFLKFSFCIYIFLLISQIHLHLNSQWGWIENVFFLPVGLSLLIPSKKKEIKFSLLFIPLVMALHGLNLDLYQEDLLSHTSSQIFEILKILIVIFAGHHIFNDTASRNLLNLIFVCATTSLIFIFFYRYLYLNEVRDFDLRPLLNLRNGDPNFLAVIFLMGSGFSLYSFKSLETSWALFSLHAMAILATQSRMGILALAMSLLWIPENKSLKFRIKPEWVVILAALGVGIFLLLFDGVDQIFSPLINRFEDISDKSNSDRIKTWMNGLKLFYENPFLGVGPDQSQNYYYFNQGMPLFQTFSFPLTVHNTWIKLLSELGIFGTTPMLIWIWLILKCLNPLRKNNLQMTVFPLLFCSLFIGIGLKDFFLFSLFLIDLNQYKTPSDVYGV